MATANQASGSGAGSTFPMIPDALNKAYDPALGAAVMAMQNFYGGYTGPSALANVVAQSFPDELATSSLTATSATVFGSLMTLTAGTVVNNISFVTAVTAGATMTNQWAGIASFATTSKVLASSADGTSAAIAADTLITYALTAPYTIPTSGLYYIYFCIKATTAPTIAAAATLSAHGRGVVSPILSGTCATTQTVPLAVGSTFTQPTAAAASPLLYIN
jgi:hypothetical protein